MQAMRKLREQHQVCLKAMEYKSGELLGHPLLNDEPVKWSTPGRDCEMCVWGYCATRRW